VASKVTQIDIIRVIMHVLDQLKYAKL